MCCGPDTSTVSCFHIFIHLIFMSFSLPDMSVKSSSSSNDFFLHSNFSSNNIFVTSTMFCLISEPGLLIYMSFYITSILLLLPLCVLVLYQGLQRWQQQFSSSTAAMSHSDNFTYHMVTMELAAVVGYTVLCCSIYMVHFKLLFVGFTMLTTTWYGEVAFNSLTCLERYMAVIHPIIYLSLKGERGVRIRNITIGCVWLLSICGTSLLILEEAPFSKFFFDICMLISSLTIIIFCSLSVVCVLIRPGPGKKVGDRERIDRSKRRAFYTIVAILGVLLVRFGWTLVWLVLFSVTGSAECWMMASGFWFNLPCSLLLPLLFLHKTGRLVCFENNTK